METTIVVIVIAVIVAAVIWFRVIVSRKQKELNAGDGVIATLNIPTGPLRLTATELIEGYAPDAPRHPIAGLVARVEDSGTLNRRITATRLVALGVFALAAPKRLDDRELYFTIEGPATALIRTIELKKQPQMGEAARKFAMQVNQHARTTTAA